MTLERPVDVEPEAASRVSAPIAPFDPRSEVSADAKAIIERLTLLLFKLPLFIALVIVLLYIIGRQL